MAETYAKLAKVDPVWSRIQEEAQDAVLTFEDKFFTNATPAQRARAHAIKQSLSLR